MKSDSISLIVSEMIIISGSWFLIADIASSSLEKIEAEQFRVSTSFYA